MPSSLPILLLLFVALCFLNAAVVVLTLSYRRLVRKYESLQISTQQLRDQAFQDANRVVGEAHAESLKILEKAHQQAGKILDDTAFFTQNAQQHLEKELGSLTQHEVEAYQALLANLRQAAQDSLADLRTDIQSIALEEMRELHQRADTEQEALQAKLQSLIQEHGYLVIQQAFQTVARKTLNSQDHETLVLEALEEARKNHVL